MGILIIVGIVLVLLMFLASDVGQGLLALVVGGAILYGLGYIVSELLDFPIVQNIVVLLKALGLYIGDSILDSVIHLDDLVGISWLRMAYIVAVYLLSVGIKSWYMRFSERHNLLSGFISFFVIGITTLYLAGTHLFYTSLLFLAIVSLVSVSAIFFLCKYKFFSKKYKNLIYRNIYCKGSTANWISSLGALSIFLLLSQYEVTEIIDFITLGMLVLWLYRYKAYPTPEKIDRYIENMLASYGRLTWDEIKDPSYGKTVPKYKACYQEHFPCDEDLAFLLEKYIEEGRIYSVDSTYYYSEFFEKELPEILGSNTWVDHDKVMSKLSDKRLVGKKAVKDLTAAESDQVAFSSLLLPIKSGLDDKGRVIFIHDPEDLADHCTYCGIAIATDEAVVEGSNRFCSYSCKHAYSNEAESFKQQLSSKPVTQVSLQSLIDSPLAENKGDAVAQKYSEYATVMLAEGVDKDHMMTTSQGHGFAAEEGNTLIDTIQGKKAQTIGYDNQKNGADRLVENVLIQTKYYKTAAASVAAGFDNGQYKYIKPNGKPMQLEVPSDQYNKAVLLMRKRIENGEVPSIKDPRYASRLVRKGHLTYDQAQSIARAGTIESIAYDFTEGAIMARSSAGMAGAFQLAHGIWRGKPLSNALAEASVTMISVYGQDVVKVMIAKQITKTAVGGIIRKNTGIIVNEAANVILPKAMATTIANIAKMNVISGSVTLAFMSLKDIANFEEGYLSGKELVGNVVGSGVQLAGAAIGGEVIGGVIGSFIPIPIVGTALGALIGGAITQPLASIFRTDADKRREAEERARIQEENRKLEELSHILQSQFSRLATVFMLLPEEVETFSKKLQARNLRADLLGIISDGTPYVTGIVRIIRPIIVEVASNRPRVVVEDTRVFDIGIATVVGAFNSKEDK